MARGAAIPAGSPRQSDGRRIVYPGNLIGSVHAPGDAEAMLRLLKQTPYGDGLQTIGHYDGSLSILLPALEERFYINAHPRDESWRVHGFIGGGQQSVRIVAAKLSGFFASIGITTEFAYLDDVYSDDCAPLPLVDLPAQF